MANRQQLNILEHFVLFGLCSALVLPPLRLAISIYLMTPIAFILTIFLVIKLTKSSLPIDIMVLIYLSLIVLMLFSTIFGYAYLSVPYSYRDFMEVFRYLQIVPYILLSKFICYESFSKKTNLYLTISSVIFILVGVFQLYNIFGLGRTIALLYADQHHVDNIARITATGSDPNVGAAIGCFFFIYFLHKTIIKRSIVSLFLIIILAYLIFSTQSRTVIFATFISNSVYFGVLTNSSKLRKLSIFIISLVALLFIVVYMDLQYIIVGFFLLFENANESVNVRLENLFLAYERLVSSPWFGWGPSKQIMDTVIDSEYALIIQRYGAIGLFIIIGNYSYILYKSKKLISAFNNKTILHNVAFTIAILALIVMLTNNFIAGSQLIAIFTFIAIFTAADTKKLRSDF